MHRKMWVVGSGVALVAAIGVGAAMLGKTANAQGSRQQVPLFEPDPL